MPLDLYSKENIIYDTHFEVIVESTKINAILKYGMKVNFLFIMRPTTKPHVTSLVVEWELANIDGT